MAQTVETVTSLPPAQSTYTPCCNPCACPCIPLQRGCKIIAIVEIILGLISTFGLAILLVSIVEKDSENCYDNPASIVVHILTLMSITVTHIFLATFLYLGAKESNRFKCGVYCVGVICMIMTVIIQLAVSLASFQVLNNIVLSCFFVYLISSVYFLYVVYCFMGEVKFKESRTPFLVPGQEAGGGDGSSGGLNTFSDSDDFVCD